jgi:3-hydroxyisobutyrate dehydrogenase
MTHDAVSPERTRIGWIGTGIMGASMCGHLVARGYRTTVYSRTRERARTVLTQGATWADSPRAVAATSDLVLTMVGYPSDVREVVLGADGVLAGAAPGSILIDMTTSEPSLAAEIDAAGRAKGVACLDAPVSGGDVGAREARLSIMIGGAAETLERTRPVLSLLGKTIVHQGGAGAGQHTKMVNQILIASGMVGLCEALLYARSAGLDPATVLASVSGGAAGSWTLSNLAPRILRGDFAPGFLVDHFVKDLGIALGEAKRRAIALPGLALAEQLYVAAQAQGHGRDGTQALMLALGALSGAAADRLVAQP